MKALNNLGKTIKNFTDNNPPVVLIEESNYFSFPYFLVGTFLGVIAGLLFTPDTGENNRRKLEEKLKELNRDEVNFSDRKSYKVREVSEDGLTDIVQERENFSHL